VAAARSYITDEMDEFSDIDLVIAVNDESYEKCNNKACFCK